MNLPDFPAAAASCWLRSAYHLALPADSVLRGAVLGGSRHRAPAVGIEQAGPQGVLELPVSEPQAAAQPADHVRGLAHALHAAGQHDVRLQQDHLPGADRRLQARPAQPVDRQGRDLRRHAGLEPHVARPVDRVRAGVQHVAEHDVVDHVRPYARPLHRGPRRNRAEIESPRRPSACRCTWPSGCGRRQGCKEERCSLVQGSRFRVQGSMIGSRGLAGSRQFEHQASSWFSEPRQRTLNLAP